MPKYGEFRFGRLQKYGRYELKTTEGGALGPHVRYRIRFHHLEAGISEYLMMYQERLAFPTNGPAQKIRIRSNTGEWAYTQNEKINKEVYKVRIRSGSADQDTSEWVYSDRASLKLI